MNEKKRILDLIDSPNDLKKLNNEELKILADEIREQIVTTTSKTGGHVGSSLGTVETILAVHSLIDSPKDKFVFDVGHQAYAHKLITGRRDQFDSIRQYKGISGFTKPSESPHDVHYSGHASDSLSIALGLAKARELKGTDENIVALIGDASIAGGMSFEALNQIGQEKIPMVIILNENNMSISQTVGGFMQHLNTLRVSEPYRSFRETVSDVLHRFGDVGEFAIKWGATSKNSLKQFFLPHSIMFEELGIICTPVIDGHDIPSLRVALRKALSSKEPVLLHVVTQKGAGYEPAIKDPERFHGIGAYDIKTGKNVGSKTYTFTDAFSDAIIEEAKTDEKIIGISAAMSKGTGLDKFEKKHPDRFIDVGIAEQHLVGIAAGLAQGGFKPVIAVYSAFLQRAIDQMIVNTALPDLNVTFCIDRAGIVGADGVTHHGQFDIAYTRMIPGLTVMAPSTAKELKRALNTALSTDGPFAIRYPKGPARDISKHGKILDKVDDSKISKVKIGKSRTLKHGNDVSILAFGDTVIDALKAWKELNKKGVYTRVIDMRFIKPMDADAIKKAALETRAIITVENGVLAGGAGEGVLYELSKINLLPETKFKSLGINDEYITHGKIKILKAKAGYDANAIVNTAIQLISD